MWIIRPISQTWSHTYIYMYVRTYYHATEFVTTVRAQKYPTSYIGAEMFDFCLPGQFYFKDDIKNL